jgi:hypothetical protein
MSGRIPGPGDDPLADPVARRIGDLVRTAAAPLPTADAAPLVRLRLGPIDPDRAVDRFYDGQRVDDPGLAALARTVAIACLPPQPVDLGSRVAAALADDRRPSRRLHPEGEVARDSEGRRRVWWWVCVGHLAAALLLLVIKPISLGEVTVSPDQAPAPASAPPPPRPASWVDGGAGLLGTRLQAVTRSDLAASHGMAAALPAIQGGTRWLASQQQIGGADDGCIAPAGMQPGHALAVHAYATLALLGEGLDDQDRAASVHRAMGWIDRQPTPTDPQVAAVVAWARVEAALLVDDPDWRDAAERSLRTLPGIPQGAGAAPALLALETAAAGGLAVPRRVLESARRQIGRPLPSEDDPAQLGLAVLTRLILGLRGLESTTTALDRLDRLPASAVMDPLAFIAPGMAVREAGGERWNRWTARHLLPLAAAFVDLGAGQRHLPADRVRWAPDAGGTVAATAWAVICLQAPYRTVPLAGSGR